MDESGGDRQVPLYQQVKAELIRAISQGDYTHAEPFITQREICDRFGVSNATAVRALNDLVAEGLLVRRRGKGTFVAEQPSRQPDGTSGERSIACVMSFLHEWSPHASALIKGIESTCAELGYRMFFSDTRGDQRLEEVALRRALQTGASGVVLYPVQGQRSSAALDLLRRHHLPVVMVDRYPLDVATDSVVADNFQVGFQLTERLVAAGHTSIAVLWEETECTSARDRLAGHVQALRRHGLPERRELTLLRSYLDHSGRRRVDTLRSLLESTDPPTAVLCANGFVLAAVINDLTAMGVQIPAAVELAAMDDAGPPDLPPLTLVAAVLPSAEMGRRAMRLLADRIDGPDKQATVQHIVLPIGIRTRESAAAHLRVVRGN